MRQYRTKATILNPFVFILTFILMVFSGAIFAYHPISQDGPFEGTYPKYPEIDYGTGDDAKLVKRGEYLAKLGDCLACHSNTQEGGQSYAGGLAMETPFGIFYSPNITPDKETGIGRWSEEDFLTAMKQGKAPDGSNYFPVFPYTYFNRMTDDDVRAMWAYFKKIPSVTLPNRKHGVPYPFSSRFLQNFWRILYFHPQKDTFEYDPEHSKEWNRGQYIVEGLGHCGMCHTPINLLGAAKEKYKLTGAFIEGYWAPNISGYALDAISQFEIADVFIDGKLLNQSRAVVGPMAQVNHNSLSHLTEKDQLAIASYLKSVSSKQPLGVAKASDAEPTLKRGKQVYINSCIICHQRGEGGAPTIGDSASWNNRAQKGMAALYRHTINGYNNMPLKGACVTCSDNDVISAVDYLMKASLTRIQWDELQGTRKKPKKPTPADGKVVYQENCAVCHDSGKLGAQMIGDQKAWKPLIHKNMDVLVLNTLNGLNNMPKKGGCKHCTTPEIIAAVKYMVEQSKSEGDYNLW